MLNNLTSEVNSLLSLLEAHAVVFEEIVIDFFFLRITIHFFKPLKITTQSLNIFLKFEFNLYL